MTTPNPTSVARLPDNVPLEVYQGDDLFFTVTVTGLVLTGGSGSAQIRRFPSSTVHVDLGVVVVAANQMEVTLTSANSALLSPGPNFWDLQVFVNGRVWTLASGPVTVYAEVTR